MSAPNDEWEQGGLGDLQNYLPASARIRQQPKDLPWQTGTDLLKIGGNLRMGITGESNTGKSFYCIDALTHRIENLAGDDEWIRQVFQHSPELMEMVLSWDLSERRAILREAHLMVFIDFDNRGLDQLIKGHVINPALLDCIIYIGVDDWEEAIQATIEAMEKLREHEANGWGNRGIFMVVDNVNEVWEEAQSDHIHVKYGMSHIELRNAIKAMHPGKDSEAMALQGEEQGQRFDWNAIKGQHKQWIKPMLNSGYNVLLTSPPKQRVQKVKNMLTGETEVLKIHSIGGAKEIVFYMDWVLHRYTTPDKSVRFAVFDKCRFSGMKSKEIYDPNFENVENEMHRIITVQVTEQKRKHALRKYAEALPDISKFVRQRDTEKRVKIDIPPPSLPNIPPPSSIPKPMTVDQSLGLADLKDATIPPPSAWAENRELPDIPPQYQHMEDDTESHAPIPGAIPGPTVNIPPPPSQPKITPDLVLSFIKENGGGADLEVIAFHFGVEYTEVEGSVFDDIISDLLNQGQLYEPSLGVVALENISSPIDESLLIPPPSFQNVPVVDPADFEPAKDVPAPIPSIPQPPQVDEVEEDNDADEHDDQLTHYIVSSHDRGKGKYHRPDCKRLAKIEKKKGIIEPEGREPCKSCKPGDLRGDLTVCPDCGAPSKGGEWDNPVNRANEDYYLCRCPDEEEEKNEEKDNEGGEW